jgi:oligoendopeptidase F
MNVVLGDLPTWNLTDLYSSPGGSDLEADLKRAAQDADAFAGDYAGKVAALDGKALGSAVARFEALQDRMGRIGSYAQLYYARTRPIPSAAASPRTSTSG